MSVTKRSRGVLIGLAVGNVMGLPWEGYPRIYVGHRPLIAPKMEAHRPSDDDVAMAMVLGRHLAENPSGIDPLGLLQEYVDWMHVSGRGIGGLTREVLQLAEQGLTKPAEFVWEQRGGRDGMVLGNGSVMRCAPLAVRYRNDLERAIEEARLDSSLTHWDERCRWASAAVVVMTARHINEAENPVGETVALLKERGAEEAVLDALTSDEVDAGFPETATLDGFGAGSCLTALRVARWASQWATDFKKSLTRVLRAGGDTDTNGSVAGAVLGARFPDAIPADWLDCIPVRQEMENLAARLSALAG